MKVKCIKSTNTFSEGDVFEALIDKSDILSHTSTTVNSAIIELYYEDHTIAQTMYRFYKEMPIECWYFDYYFKKHFQIITD